MSAIVFDPAGGFAVEETDVEYRRDGDASLLARIFRPVGEGPFPAMVAVHGGAWNVGDRMDNAEVHRALAACGMVVAAIDFRQAPDHPYPASIVDTNYAVRWLKTHAAQYNAIAGTVGLIGASSGGHVSMLSAMRPNDSRYAAIALPEAPDVDASVAYVVSLWGVLDPYNRYWMVQEQGRADMVANHHRYWIPLETQREGSPVLILERGEKIALPPVLAIQGTADVNIPVGTLTKFCTLYGTAGGDVVMDLVPGMPHGLAGWPDAERHAMFDRIKAFIAKTIATPAGVA